MIIADYLPKTSRALFAVALTAPSSSFRAVGWGRGELSAGTKAIIGRYSVPSRLAVSGLNHPWSKKNIEEYYASNWEILNFIDLDDAHAKKLTDDELGALLVCIDAKKKLKKLILPWSVLFGSLIVGHGLEPLRGSRALEEIDCLGGGTRNCSDEDLLHHIKKPISITSPSLRVRMIKTSLSTSAIVSVLDSIIDADGNSLSKVILPLPEDKWPTPRNSPMLDFLGKINQTMHTQEIECEGANCTTLVEGKSDNCCQVCCSRICATCNEIDWDDMGDRRFIQMCKSCNRKLCFNCDEMVECAHCQSLYCSTCSMNRFCYEGCNIGCFEQCEIGECVCGCRSVGYSKLAEEKRSLAEENNLLRQEIEQLRTNE